MKLPVFNSFYVQPSTRFRRHSTILQYVMRVVAVSLKILLVQSTFTSRPQSKGTLLQCAILPYPFSQGMDAQRTLALPCIGFRLHLMLVV